MSPKILLALFFLFIYHSSFSQVVSPIKWGKVNPKDLAMTAYDRDTTAEAVVLTDFGSLNVVEEGNRFKYIFKHHKRIKILHRNAENEANIVIPYRKGERIYNIKGQTISPDGTVTPIGSKDVFVEDVHEYLKLKKFSLPNVQVGSVIEYKYEKKSEAIVTLEEWYFQGKYPVRYSEFNVSIHKILEYTFLFQGKEKTEDSQEVDGLIEIDKGKFVMRNAPALKEEAFITTMDNYRARLHFQLSKIWWRKQPPETFMSTWPELVSELYHHNSFGKQYRFKRNFSKAWAELEPLIIGQSKQEQIKTIYEFVQQKLTWNNFYSRYTKGTLNDAYKEGAANIADINLLLVGLLREAGIKANPMLCGLRSDGIPMEEYPIIDQFSYVLAYVEEGDTPLLLDASSDYFPMGFVRTNALNYKGWVVDYKNARWEKITPQKSEDIFWAGITLDKEGKLNGKMKIRSSGYSAINERIKHKKSSGKHWQKRLEKQIPDLKIETINFKDETNIEKPYSAEVDFVWKGASQNVGNFLYISPIIYTNFKENPFKLEERLYPVEIPYPIKEQLILNLTIPEGYEVDALPDLIHTTFPNKDASFRYLAEVVGNQITLTCKIQINRLVYESHEYPALKGLFDTIVEALNEPIVLKKK